jgi:hypothetical protein
MHNLGSGCLVSTNESNHGKWFIHCSFFSFSFYPTHFHSQDFSHSFQLSFSIIAHFFAFLFYANNKEKIVNMSLAPQQPNFNALEKNVLTFLAACRQLSGQNQARVMQIAKACGQTKSSHVNPTLYALQSRGLVIADPAPYWEITQIGSQLVTNWKQEPAPHQTTKQTSCKQHNHVYHHVQHTSGVQQCSLDARVHPATKNTHPDSFATMNKHPVRSFSPQPTESTRFDPALGSHDDAVNAAPSAAAAASASSVFWNQNNHENRTSAWHHQQHQKTVHQYIPKQQHVISAQQQHSQTQLLEPWAHENGYMSSTFSLPPSSTRIIHDALPERAGVQNAHLLSSEDARVNRFQHDMKSQICNLCSAPVSALVLIDLNNVSDVLPKLDALDIVGLHVIGFANEQYNGVGVHSNMSLRHSMKDHSCTFCIVRLSQGVSCHLQMIWTMAAFLFSSKARALQKVIIAARGNTFQGVQTVLHATHTNLQSVLQASSWADVEPHVIFKSE